MRIRATILTPVLAVFTVVALIGTGIVINQVRHEDVIATAVGSMPDLAAATTTTTVVVADAVLTEGTEPVAPGAVRASSAPSYQEATEQEEPEDEEENEDEPSDEAEEDD